MAKICRLCFASESSCEDTEYTSISKFVPFLNRLCPGIIGSSQDDTVPQDICSNCEFQIETAILLQKRLKFTEAVWGKHKDRLQDTSRSCAPVKSIVNYSDLFLNCHECGQIFDYHGLQTHVAAEHGDGHVSECPFCSTILDNTAPLLPDHQEPLVVKQPEEVYLEEYIPHDDESSVFDDESKALSEKTFSCHICPQSFKRKDTLKRHIQLRHINAMPKTIESSFVEVIYSANGDGVRHKFFRCRVCGVKKPRIDTVKRHVKFVHKEEMKLAQASKEYVPNVDFTNYLPENSEVMVQETQLSQVNLQSPKVEDLGMEELPEITQRPNESEFMTSIDDGMTSDTPTKEHFSCTICHKQISSKHSLERHMRSQHKGYNPSDGPVPLKEPTYIVEFKILSDGQKVKYVSCYVCDRQLSRKDSLERHIRTKHKGYEIPQKESYSANKESPNELTMISGETSNWKDTTENQVECSMDSFQEQDPVPGSSVKENSVVEHAEVLSQSGSMDNTSEFDEQSTTEILREGPYKNQRVTCPICRKTLCRLDGLRRHMFLVHKKKYRVPSIKMQYDRYRVSSIETCSSTAEHNDTDQFLGTPSKASKSMEDGTGPGETVQGNQRRDNRYKCFLCGDIVGRIDGLRRHMRIIHGTELEAWDQGSPSTAHSSDCKCPICGIVVAAANNLWSHLKDLHGIEDKRTGRQKERRNQRKTVPKQKVGNVSCEICGKTFTRRDILNRHMSVHEGPICTRCCSVFPTNEELASHVEEYQNYFALLGVDNFPCDKCDRKFNSVCEQKRHRLTHGVHRCNNCNMVLDNEKDLTSHKHHGPNPCLGGGSEKKKKWGKLCGICGVWVKGVFKDHLAIHEGIKPYTCVAKGCGKAFRTKQLLTLHRQRHSHVPVTCDFEGCGMRFCGKRTLIRHQRTHTGEKRFKCTFDDCTREFHGKFDLELHLRRHTGEKPFECTGGCIERFYTRSLLRKHQESCSLMDTDAMDAESETN